MWRRVGDGTVFEMAHGSGTITTLASFNGTNGASPEAGVIMDSSGNLYGTTSEGGTRDQRYGTVFELAHGSGTITTLASFNGNNGLDSAGRPDHGQQRQSLRHDHGQAPMATAQFSSWPVGSATITTLASFNGHDGASRAGLIMDSSGNFYGTTWAGGVGTDDSSITGDGGTFSEVLTAHARAELGNAQFDHLRHGPRQHATGLLSAADSVTGKAVAGKFAYTPAAGTILPGGLQTLSVTFTPTGHDRL